MEEKVKKTTTEIRLWTTGRSREKKKKKKKKKKKQLEDPGIDPGTSRMLSERSTI